MTTPPFLQLLHFFCDLKPVSLPVNLSEDTASAFAILCRFPGLLEFAMGNRTFSPPSRKEQRCCCNLLPKASPSMVFHFMQHFPSVSLCQRKCSALIWYYLSIGDLPGKTPCIGFSYIIWKYLE